MKYIIKDLQFQDRYFGGDEPVAFNSRREAIEQLIDYHSNDNDMGEEKKMLKNNDMEKLEIFVRDFEWDIVENKERAIK